MADMLVSPSFRIEEKDGSTQSATGALPLVRKIDGEVSSQKEALEATYNRAVMLARERLFNPADPLYQAKLATRIQGNKAKLGETSVLPNRERLIEGMLK
jgi:hypothetical protein